MTINIVRILYQASNKYNFFVWYFARKIAKPNLHHFETDEANGTENHPLVSSSFLPPYSIIF